jgi:hypothetical protein
MARCASKICNCLERVEGFGLARPGLASPAFLHRECVVITERGEDGLMLAAND